MNYIYRYITLFIFLIFLKIVLVFSWKFLTSYYVEAVFPLYPLIDTKLPPGFSLEKFENIQIGMTKNEVLKILPPPISSPIVLKNSPPIYTLISSRQYNRQGNPVFSGEIEKEWSIDDDAWYYGEDGACLFADFAWFKFEIHFDKENKVVKKLFNINYD
jgi:hypothetical protein